jgi:uncharacterized protein (DUF488 family)
MRLLTIGHGTRPVAELIECLQAGGARTVVDVRRFPTSRRNPQFSKDPLEAALAGAGIGYRHVGELGGRRRGEPGEEQFGCIETPGFRSYAARMGQPEWQAALAEALAEPAPCFLCAETLWWRCHRRLIADLLLARGHDVLHLIRPHDAQPHRLPEHAEVRSGRLYLCGRVVA